MTDNSARKSEGPVENRSPPISTNSYTVFIDKISSRKECTILLSSKDFAFTYGGILHRVPYNEIQQVEQTSHFNWKFWRYEVIRIRLSSRIILQFLSGYTHHGTRERFAVFADQLRNKIENANRKFVSVRGYSPIRWWLAIVYHLTIIAFAVRVVLTAPRSFLHGTIVLILFALVVAVSFYSVLGNRPKFLNFNRPKPIGGVIRSHLSSILKEPPPPFPFRLIKLYLFQPNKLAEEVKRSPTKSFAEAGAAVITIIGLHFAVFKALFSFFGVDYDLGQFAKLQEQWKLIQPVVASVFGWLVIRDVFGYHNIRLITYIHVNLFFAIISIITTTIYDGVQYTLLLNSIAPVDVWNAALPAEQRVCQSEVTFSCLSKTQKFFEIERSAYVYLSVGMGLVLIPLLVLSTISQFKLFKFIMGIKYWHTFFAPIIGILISFLVGLILLYVYGLPEDSYLS